MCLLVSDIVERRFCRAAPLPEPVASLLQAYLQKVPTCQVLNRAVNWSWQEISKKDKRLTVMPCFCNKGVNMNISTKGQSCFVCKEYVMYASLMHFSFKVNDEQTAAFVSLSTVYAQISFGGILIRNVYNII